MMPSLVELVILIAVAAIVVALAGGIGTGKRGTGKRIDEALGAVQFVSSRTLLSAVEKAAFTDLVKALARRGYVCPKVRIADLITVRSKNRSLWRTAFNRIACKHVDFAVMSLKGDILFAVEIDDRSHERADRKRRDRLVNHVFEAAGIPLVRAAPGELSRSEALAAIIERCWPAPRPGPVVDDQPAPPKRFGTTR